MNDAETPVTFGTDFATAIRSWHLHSLLCYNQMLYTESTTIWPFVRNQRRKQWNRILCECLLFPWLWKPMHDDIGLLFVWGSESYPILYLWGSYLINVVFQVFSWNFALLRQFLKQINWNTYIHHTLCFKDFLLRENLTSTVKFSRKLTDATVSHTAYKLSTFSGL